MSFTMQADGPRFLAELLAGSGNKINGMYVEYSTKEKTAGVRTHEYFRNLRNTKSAGYGRVAVTLAHVDDNNVVHFDALIKKQDLTGNVPSRAKYVCATLVHMRDSNPDNDVILWTVSFTDPVPVTDNEFTTIHTSMRFGA